MKKFYIVLITWCFGLVAQAQVPSTSPKSVVKQRVGIADVTVEYHRPGAKGRKIFGGLVPYEVVWRTGANTCTKIIFEMPVQVEGKHLPAGEYCLFTIPGQKEWTIIFNNNIKQWGAFAYNEQEDTLRVNVVPSSTDFTETFTIGFSSLTTHSANIDLSWEKVKASFKISFDIQDTVLANIKKAIAENPDKTFTYTGPAAYYLENNIDLPQALEWINKSVAIQEAYFNVRIKTEILYAMKNCKEAAAAARRTMELGEKVKDQFSYTQRMEEIIKKCEK